MHEQKTALTTPGSELNNYSDSFSLHVSVPVHKSLL